MEILGIATDALLEKGIVVLMFIWLLFDTRKNSKERETKLIEQIDTQNKTQNKIVKTLERMEQKINNFKK